MPKSISENPDNRSSVQETDLLILERDIIKIETELFKLFEYYDKHPEIIEKWENMHESVIKNKNFTKEKYDAFTNKQKGRLNAFGIKLTKFFEKYDGVRIPDDYIINGRRIDHLKNQYQLENETILIYVSILEEAINQRLNLNNSALPEYRSGQRCIEECADTCQESGWILFGASTTALTGGALLCAGASCWTGAGCIFCFTGLYAGLSFQAYRTILYVNDCVGRCNYDDCL